MADAPERPTIDFVKLAQEVEKKGVAVVALEAVGNLAILTAKFVAQKNQGAKKK